MKKILCAVIIVILITSVAPIGECSVSDEMVDIMETLEMDFSKLDNAYLMVFTNPKKVFISDDGKTIEDVFDFNHYQMPSEGKVYIWTFGEDEAVIFLYNSNNEMLSVYNLKEHIDLINASLDVTACCLSSNDIELNSLNTVSKLFSKVVTKTHAAMELISYAKGNATTKSTKTYKDKWYKTK